MKLKYFVMIVIIIMLALSNFTVNVKHDVTINVYDCIVPIEISAKVGK